MLSLAAAGVIIGYPSQAESSIAYAGTCEHCKLSCLNGNMAGNFLCR